MAAAGAATSNIKPDLHRLTETAQRKLIVFLQSVRGRKDLVIDSDVLPLLEIIAGARLLKSQGVDKIYKLENQFGRGCNQRRIYLTYPHLHKAKIIADHINADKNSGDRYLRSIDVAMIPRKLYYCEELFEYEGVFGDVSITSLDLGFIPIQKDVINLNIPWFNREFFLHKDQTWIHSVASALHIFQCQFGKILEVYSQGKASELVAEMLKNVFDKLPNTRKPSSDISHLFLIDRTVDYPSALLSQLTYEGQLDETFTIQNGFVTLSPDDTGKKEEMKIKLSSDDVIFQEIRDAHIIKAFEILSKKVKELVSSSKKRQEMSVIEMKEFISSKLKLQQEEHKFISQHISACEVIFKKNTSNQVQDRMTIERNIIEGMSYKETLNFIEDNIILKAPVYQILRLLCLLSLTQDGLPSKDYKSLRTKFLQSYGYQHLITFINLNKMGLLMEQDSKPLPPLKTAFVEKMASAAAYRVGTSSFHACCKKLNLLPKPDVDYDAKDPTDPAYVFGGIYIPLTCNLVMQILENPASLEDILKTVTGPHTLDTKIKSARGTGGQTSSDFKESSRTILIVFLGGLTLAEVGAFRLLERIKGYRIILATTSIINGNVLMQNAIEEFKCIQEAQV